MCRISSGRRLLLAGALAFFLPQSGVLAQDKPAVGKPVTSPETDKDATGNPANAVQPAGAESAQEALPPVAESPGDPAPIGTRGVPVGRGRAGLKARMQPNRRLGPGVRYAEGVVTTVEVPGPNQPGVRLLMTIDSAQDWEGPPKTQGEEAQVVPESPLAGAPAGAATDVDGDLVIPLAITARTHLTHAVRTSEGVDQYTAPARGTTSAANSTNIQRGYYVAVRYRRVGDTNVALNVSVIQLPKERMTGGRNVPRVPLDTGGNADTLPR